MAITYVQREHFILLFDSLSSDEQEEAYRRMQLKFFDTTNEALLLQAKRTVQLREDMDKRLRELREV